MHVWGSGPPGVRCHPVPDQGGTVMPVAGGRMPWSGDACSTVGRGLSPATLKCRKPVKLCGAAYAGVAAQTIDELGDLGMDKVRWGFLGAGSIANRLGEGLMQVDDAELLAVGSRTADRRQALAERFGVPRQYATYEELVQDPDIDVVYIATPHNLHREHSILAWRPASRSCAKSRSPSMLRKRPTSSLWRGNATCF